LLTAIEFGKEEKDCAEKLRLKEMQTSTAYQTKANIAKNNGFDSPEEMAEAAALAKEARRQGKSLTELHADLAKNSNIESSDQKHQFDLPDRTSRKPEQRAQKTFEIAESEPEKKQSIRQRTVTDGYQPAQGDARVYLLGQYEENGILCCQICHREQPIKVNEEYVFDARDCITGINGFHKANNLCLCPNHSRMFTAAKLSEETLREAILNTDAKVATDQRKIPLDLGGNQVEIYFTKNHLSDLQAVLRAVFENS
ncbi:MAG: hypothetical protein WAW61_12795, partial [Methylococcaceae bacterium]